MFKKIILQEGVNLYVRQTEQFKTINFSLKWKTELDEQKAGVRAVLANVLQESTERWPTQTSLRNALDELYGAVMFTDAGKRANTHIVSLYAEWVNDEYVEGTPVLDEMLKLIHEVVFKPNMTNGQFDEATTVREKRSVKERIRSIYDDKTRYAQKRMLELLRPDSPVSVSSYGTEQGVDAVSSADVKQAYDQMLTEDEIDIYVVGHIDEQAIETKIRELFPFASREINIQEKQAAKQGSVEKAAEVKKVFEKQDMKQGKLHMGFSTPVLFSHPDYLKMQITNGILGGFSHSKLFMNVREKESMAYYVNSSYSAHYGLIYVMSGIDAELEEKAVQLIQEQLKSLQQGDITDLELDQTKALLTNSIKSTFDSARGQIEVFDQYKLLDEHFNADLLIKGWDAVTKEDVQKMASQITLEIVYLLSGKEAA